MLWTLNLRWFYMFNHFFQFHNELKNRFEWDFSKLDHIVLLQSYYILHNSLCNSDIWLVPVIYSGQFHFHTFLLTIFFKILCPFIFNLSLLYSAEFGDYIIYLFLLLFSIKQKLIVDRWLLFLISCNILHHQNSWEIVLIFQIFLSYRTSFLWTPFPTC